MSCPDWRELIAQRHRRGGAEPEGWEVATTHLDDCPACRPVAERLDPTLLFRRLPSVSAEEAAIEDMRRRVELLRRARRVESGGTRRHRWAESAAAALLAVGLLGVFHGTPQAGEEAPRPGAATATSSTGGITAELSGLPVLEHVEQPFDQIVQWSSEELSMILLLDERFDV